jgi:hypothetical protein
MRLLLSEKPYPENPDMERTVSGKAGNGAH